MGAILFRPARRAATISFIGAGLTYAILKVVSLFVPLRVSQQHELEGLDISQHGEALQS